MIHQKENSFLIIIITLLLLCITLILGACLHIMFEWNLTIIAGLIGFVGAIIGGMITFYGVRVTIWHRDKEIFLSTATSKLLLITTKIEPKYKEIANEALLYSNVFNLDIDYHLKAKRLHELMKRFIYTSYEDMETLYDIMEYEDIKGFHQSLKEMREEVVNESNVQLNDLIQLIQQSYQYIFATSAKLEKKYFQYKKQVL
ncbi:hypothetical protein ACFOST_07935 [Cytobacillus kochii]|uniref:hypothetical protein n=1 Tax=Cytobacillus kochii TaxID=859143 RepID=UPI00277DB755|nr:hypothetical protein [Cytobacillus kochii]MDQ0184524.1 hypothetical protein [Cytobacillus kochii]